MCAWYNDNDNDNNDDNDGGHVGLYFYSIELGGMMNNNNNNSITTLVNKNTSLQCGGSWHGKTYESRL